MNNKNEFEQTTDKILKDILINIRNEQKELEKIIVDNNKILMKRINILQEYNEICDMRHRNIYNELKNIKEKIL